MGGRRRAADMFTARVAILDNPYVAGGCTCSGVIAARGAQVLHAFAQQSFHRLRCRKPDL